MTLMTSDDGRHALTPKRWEWAIHLYSIRPGNRERERERLALSVAVDDGQQLSERLFFLVYTAVFRDRIKSGGTIRMAAIGRRAGQDEERSSFIFRDFDFCQTAVRPIKNEEVAVGLVSLLLGPPFVIFISFAINKTETKKKKKKGGTHQRGVGDFMSQGV